jgi:BASS family bile acid:Na+ symporter
MEAIKQLIPILLTVSLAGLVVSVGLNATVGDLLFVLRRPVVLLKAVIAVDVIPVAAAVALCLFLPLDPSVKAGIVLMAISPAPPLVPGQLLGVGARKEFAYGVYIAMVLVTIVAVPGALAIATRLFGREDAVPVMRIAKVVLTGVLIPLAIGMALRLVAPRLSRSLAPWVGRLSMLLVVVAFVPIVVVMWGAITHLVGNGTLAAMAAVVLVALAGGHLLGGPDREDRATLAIASSVRHPGIAILLAAANGGGRDVAAAVVLFMLVGMVVSIPYKRWIKRSAPFKITPPA